ncbi:hypothetical protein BDZ45DRAFT_691821 [Acephala macrosclerotiorum]|nr:hypothetical protein BDZ45DRAFT_691821 [Acephala macrosclerotiorum]
MSHETKSDIVYQQPKTMSSGTHPYHAVEGAGADRLSRFSEVLTSSPTSGGLTNDLPSQDQLQPLSFDKFTLFPKLPTELRLAVWAFASPGLAVIIQKMSRVRGRRFHFDRAVPAVLHTCRESREMFLDGGEGDKKKTSSKKGKGDEGAKKYRKRDHPVYKFCFRNQSPKSGGAFFSAGIDSFWGMQYHGKRGITNLNVLPNLGTLTVLIPEAELFFGRHGRDVQMGSYEPEVNGELDDSDSASARGHHVSKAKLLTKELDKLKILHPDKSFPVLKFRWEKQFVEVENLNVPKPM